MPLLRLGGFGSRSGSVGWIGGLDFWVVLLLVLSLDSFSF